MRHRVFAVATATNTKQDLFENWSQTISYISFAIATAKRSFDALICRIWANGFMTDMKSINNFLNVSSHSIECRRYRCITSLAHFTHFVHDQFMSVITAAIWHCNSNVMDEKNWDNEFNCTVLGVHFKVDCSFGVHNENSIAEKSIQSE